MSPGCQGGFKTLQRSILRCPGTSEMIKLEKLKISIQTEGLGYYEAVRFFIPLRIFWCKFHPNPLDGCWEKLILRFIIFPLLGAFTPYPTPLPHPPAACGPGNPHQGYACPPFPRSPAPRRVDLGVTPTRVTLVLASPAPYPTAGSNPDQGSSLSPSSSSPAALG